jgi:ribosome biogenesis GTPase
MDLEEIGWDDHFQNQVDKLGLTDIIIGRVFKVEAGDLYGILTETGEISARISGRIKKQAFSGSELPGIGDWVLVKPLQLNNMIFKVLDRKNQISRQVAGKEYKEQMVGANIDIIFIIMGLDKDYNIRRLERYFFMIVSSDSQPVVILNKTDLLDEDEIVKKVQDVESVTGDVHVHTISALEEEGLDAITQYLEKKGTTVSLVGSSGVGKSTIINALLGEKKQITGEVRKKDDKGRHITSSRELFLLPGGGVVIDNPGIREIQLWGDIDSLDSVFPDIRELALGCKFKDCSHISEPECAVKHAVEEEKTLSKKRYDNYIKMRKELVFLQKKRKMSSEAMEKSRWKGLQKDAKRYRKYKEERQ